METVIERETMKETGEVKQMKRNEDKSHAVRTHLIVGALMVTAVFMSSFCIMVVELMATRLVTRFLGASLYTWTSVIGVVLAGIAVGNYLGGRLSDRYRPERMLALIFIGASAACAVIPVANRLMGSVFFF